MSEPAVRQRVSRHDWLLQGLRVLRERGVEAVKIEHLSRSLGVAKTGFYWHFKNRAELLGAMLEYWEREYTTVIAENTEIAAMRPVERLLAISEAVAEQRLAEFDIAISAWAQHDPKVAALLEHAYAIRMNTVRAAFRELEFRGDELEMRTRLFVCYHSNEDAMFGPQTGSRSQQLRRLGVGLLAQGPQIV